MERALYLLSKEEERFASSLQKSRRRKRGVYLATRASNDEDKCDIKTLPGSNYKRCWVQRSSFRVFQYVMGVLPKYKYCCVCVCVLFKRKKCVMRWELIYLRGGDVCDLHCQQEERRSKSEPWGDKRTEGLWKGEKESLENGERVFYWN